MIDPAGDSPDASFADEVVVQAGPMDVLERSTPRAGIALLTLNRPSALNAMTAELVQALHDELDAIAVDPDVRVVVLTGAGRGFCAGLDLRGYGDTPNTAHLGRTQGGFATQRHIASSGAASSIPAAAGDRHGERTGGRRRVRTRTGIGRAARSGIVQVRRHVHPDRSVRMRHRYVVDSAPADRHVARPGTDVDGQGLRLGRGGRIGLIIERVPDDSLLDVAYAKAAQIMANSPFGVALTKEGMWSALEIPGMQAAIDLENRQQIMASATADHREAMSAFIEQHDPDYTNG